MNWDVISSLSELVSAAAVVITLIFLTLELRRTRKAAESQGTLTSVGLASNVRTNILQNSDIAEALAGINAGDELTKTQRVQIAMLSDELFISLAVANEFSASSGALHDLSAEIQYGIDILKANPGLVSEWERLKPFIRMISPSLIPPLDASLTKETLDDGHVTQ